MRPASDKLSIVQIIAEAGMGGGAVKARHFILCGVLAVAIWAAIILVGDNGEYISGVKRHSDSFFQIEEFSEKIPNFIRKNYEFWADGILEHNIPYSEDVEITYDGIIGKGPVYAVVSGHVSDGEKSEEYVLFLQKSLIGNTYRDIDFGLRLVSQAEYVRVSSSAELLNFAMVNIFVDTDTREVTTSLGVHRYLITGLFSLAVIYVICCFAVNRHLKSRKLLKKLAGDARYDDDTSAAEDRTEERRVVFETRHFIICGVITLCLFVPLMFVMEYVDFYGRYPAGQYEHIKEEQFAEKLPGIVRYYAYRDNVSEIYSGIEPVPYDESSTVEYSGVVGESLFIKMTRSVLKTGGDETECYVSMIKPALGRTYIHNSIRFDPDGGTLRGDFEVVYVLGFLGVMYTYYSDTGEFTSDYKLSMGAVSVAFRAVIVFLCVYLVEKEILKKKVNNR